MLSIVLSCFIRMGHLLPQLNGIYGSTVAHTALFLVLVVTWGHGWDKSPHRGDSGVIPQACDIQ